jgi:adenosine deaminase
LNTETDCYSEIFSQIFQVSSTNYNGLLKSLLLAPEKATSLAEMFRGDCFFGALHLQYYENIVACIWYLADQAVEEKNRYLEIRVSPSGYTSKDLCLKEAVEALKDGANFASLYYFMKGEFVWINFISTLKRHKTSKERIEELVTALIEDEKTSKMLESNINKVILETASPKSTYLPYDWKASRFVGVDLAGYESEFPPVNFIEDFTPAFKLNTLITIHAGEEAGPQFIWEALYKLQADRIGHGLTIFQAPKLMEKVCDKQTCIELCPLSNEITNFRGRSNKYPLFRYLKKGLNVTINTDDKAQTGGNINEDFIKAAEYFYLSEDNEKKIPLTKWETLRLVKAGFDNAFIHREEKRKLLRWVEEEIYEIILKDYEIEPYYIVDK